MASVQSQLTVTSELFHPFAFGAGLSGLKVTTGLVASRFTVTDFDLGPFDATTAQVTVSPEVSVVTRVVSHPVELSMVVVAVFTAQLTLTAPRYQPPPPSVPLTVGMSAGSFTAISNDAYARFVRSGIERSKPNHARAWSATAASVSTPPILNVPGANGALVAQVNFPVE